MISQVDHFDSGSIVALMEALMSRLTSVYRQERPMPSNVPEATLIPRLGVGVEGTPEIWDMIVEGSAKLASPWMSGHMDTAPHPVAALTQSLVAALNNNMLFRELSPFASSIEEVLIKQFGQLLELNGSWPGVFASGGSAANLTALFAACGGYSDVDSREHVHVLIPASGHLSLSKSAHILGIPASRIFKIACDAAGRIEVSALEQHLKSMPANSKKIVVSVLGTTIHGSVDDISAIDILCKNYDAWHHIDAIYGAALMFSKSHRGYLKGLSGADSIVLGPQKWMYVPRVCALTLIKDAEQFDQRLGMGIPYSLGSLPHRGRWGIQGSRPADAVPLWALLQVLGTDKLAAWIDHSIELTKRFHTLLQASQLFRPTHQPDLNLQVFRVGDPDHDGQRLMRIQQRLADQGRTWLSVSRWADEALLRSVLLSPNLDDKHLSSFVSDIESCLD